MKIKKPLIFFALLIVLALPLSYLFNSFDIASSIVFLVIVLIFLIINRKKLSIQKLIFPLFYMVLYRTKLGLKFMEKVSSKYRELIKFISLCFIGIGFLGMVFISIFMFIFLFNLFITPAETSQGVALVLPFTNIPGIGYLSFWHFIIGLFIVVVIHEGSHGIVARAYNQKIKSSGFAFFSVFIPLLPAAFVEPDEKKLVKQDPIIQYSIFSAGPVMNLIVAYIILMLLPFVVSPYQLAPFEDKITEPVGISFKEATEGYPVSKSGLQPGTVITSFNGEEIKDTDDFLKYAYYIKPNQNVTLSTENASFEITTTYYPDNSSPKGYFGMAGINNERRIIPKYSPIAGSFYWFKGLIKWLFIFNFFIGLMNLLPIFITDGGRMLALALKTTIKDEKKAMKVNTFIGLLFVFTLLGAFAVKYLGKFFGLG